VKPVFAKIKVANIETAITKRISVKAAGDMSFATLITNAKEQATKPEKAKIDR